MYSATRISTSLLSICVFAVINSPSFGMISVGVLTEKTAKEKYGITMHAARMEMQGSKSGSNSRKKAGWKNSPTPNSGWRMPVVNTWFLLNSNLILCIIASPKTSPPLPFPLMSGTFLNAAFSWCAMAVTKATSVTI